MSKKDALKSELLLKPFSKSEGVTSPWTCVQIAQLVLTRTAFLSTDHTLNTLDPEYSSKWRKYLQLKQHFYMAYVSERTFHLLMIPPASTCFAETEIFLKTCISLLFVLPILLFAGVLLSWANPAGRRQVWGGNKIPPGGRKVYVLDFTQL